MLELLAPAGSMEALRAAVQNGANAVYLGCGIFNARQGAKNFTPETLMEAVRYCHIRGVAVHLTLNTLVTDRETQELCELIRHAAICGVDAFIVQDLNVVRLCKQIAPHISVHGSTQLTVHSLPGVELCAAMGMDRVVLSRELSQDEISYICANSPIEIEIFAHGALCMCYSGQCYLSAAIGGRSGNRGRCAQPCRQSYGYTHWSNQYPLSLKDNCLVRYVQQIEAMGVASIKLEGRMKRPEYVAAVTSVYRRALDGEEVSQTMMKTLHAAFNRQGFTDGYYRGQVGGNMFGVRQEDGREDQTWAQVARTSYETGERELVGITFQAMVTQEGSSLVVFDDRGNRCEITGPQPELARTIPLTDETLAQRLSKTGGTPYRVEEVRCYVGPGLILSAAAINAMRRDALNQLTAIRARHTLPPLGKPQQLKAVRGNPGLPGLTVQVTTREQITKKIINAELAMLYVPMHILLADEKLCRVLVSRGNLAAVLPRIVHDNELPKLRKGLADLYALGVRDVLVGNLGLMASAREAGMRMHGDFGLNLMNSGAMHMARQLELVSATVSFEATLPQIRDMSKPISVELIAYGRLPLMVTEHCLIRNRTGKCTCHLAPMKLTDKTGAEFPVIRDADSCRSVLLNGKKLSWLDRQEDLSKLGLWGIRLSFTTENSREVDRTLEEYLAPQPFDPGACTRGLYLRGVE